MLNRILANSRFKLQQRVPLRVGLVVPFVVQIVAAVGLTGVISLRNGQRAVNNLAILLSQEVTARIDQHVQDYLEETELLQQGGLAAIQSGELDPTDLSALGNYFWHQFQLSKSVQSVSSIYFGNEQGEFVGVQRRDNDQTVLWYMDADNAPVRSTYELDALGNRTSLLSTQDYDPRQRPWYKAANQAQELTWSPIYEFASNEYSVLGITPASPLYGQDGNLLGVAAIDLTLSQISEFLRQLEISPSGQAFIIERTGEIVASSVEEAPFVASETEEGEEERLKALSSQAPLIRATTQQLLDQFDNLDGIQEPQQMAFRLEGQRQLVQVISVRDQEQNPSLDWLIVVVIPEADFMAQINANTRTTIWLCLGALGIAIVLGIFTARWLTRPIYRLSAASQAIAGGKLDQTVNVQGVKELEILAQSFNRMAGQVKLSFEELETRVEERTAELRRAKDAADAASRSKSEFLANISHELRTPLNAILGFAQLIRHDRTLPAEHQENLGIISRSGEHLLTLINDVLDMSKIEAGQVVLHEDNFQLSNLLDNLEGMFRLKAQSKGLTLKFERHPALPDLIYADESKLRQVLINLLGNAIKFTKRGQVTLRVKSEQMAGVPASEESVPDTFLHFEVEDTGIGIAPAEMETLFDAFVQAESAQVEQKGTGLGLAISQSFVQMMGGNISLESTPGVGTIFRFDAAIQVLEQDRSNAPVSHHKSVVRLAPDQQTYRILVVDDRIENATLLVKLMATLGFEVKQVLDGEAALEVWETWMPHLIWMDIRMPGMDGYAVTKQIRARADQPQPVIIALTASAFQAERTRVLAAGCDDFVSKPFHNNVIFEKLAEHLNVQYLYAEELTSSDAQGDMLDVDLVDSNFKVDLTVMPLPWVEQLRRATTRADSESVYQLLAEIPEEHTQVSQVLSKLVNEFDFESIIDLIPPLAAGG